MKCLHREGEVIRLLKVIVVILILFRESERMSFFLDGMEDYIKVALSQISSVKKKWSQKEQVNFTQDWVHKVSSRAAKSEQGHNFKVSLTDNTIIISSLLHIVFR
jgi:hypothetical protein